MYLANYEIKIKKGNSWDEIKRDGNTYCNLADCVTWLNNKYNHAFSDIFEGEDSEVENPNEKDIFFFWAISNAENSYAGNCKLNNFNFLEKILQINLEEFRK